jgi:hypothetical protein
MNARRDLRNLSLHELLRQLTVPPTTDEFKPRPRSPSQPGMDNREPFEILDDYLAIDPEP